MENDNPIIQSGALLTLGDPTRLDSCDLSPEMIVAPWDVCCADPDVVRASIATIQVIDENGTPVSWTAGLGGLQELSELIVVGEVSDGSTQITLRECNDYDCLLGGWKQYNKEVIRLSLILVLLSTLLTSCSQFLPRKQPESSSASGLAGDMRRPGHVQPCSRTGGKASRILNWIPSLLPLSLAIPILESSVNDLNVWAQTRQARPPHGLPSTSAQDFSGREQAEQRDGPIGSRAVGERRIITFG